MKLSRRRILHLATGASVLPFTSRIAMGQVYPSRPVRWVVPFPPGGTTDMIARLMGQYLAERLGYPFVIENRPGASGNIGTNAVIRSAADGYTLLLIGSYNTTNTTLYQHLNFNFINDIAPIAGLISYSNVMLVSPSFPVRTVPELIAYAKANPGKISMASPGNGTMQHLSGVLFKLMAGIDVVHVPYRGDAAALTDLLGGQVQVYFGAMPGSIEQIRSGKVRILAVTASARSETLPEVPSVADFVPGYEASGFIGMGAPKGTPRDVINTLNKEINAGFGDPKLRARLADLGCAPFALSPGDLGKLIAEETAKWGKVIRTANIKAE